MNVDELLHRMKESGSRKISRGLEDLFKSVFRSGAAGAGAQTLGAEGLRRAHEGVEAHLRKAHMVQERLTFRNPLDLGGGLDKKTEEWIRIPDPRGQHDQMVKVITESRVYTCSGRFVEPTAIVGLCQITGKPDRELFNCICGASICAVHAKVMRLPAESSPLCPVCFLEAQKRINVWEVFDLNRKNRTARVQPESQVPRRKTHD